MPINTNNTNNYFTWQALIWRLLLSALLLLILATSGVTTFSTAKSQPDAHILPDLTYQSYNLEFLTE